jgi:hypothetical protein
MLHRQLSENRRVRVEPGIIAMKDLAIALGNRPARLPKWARHWSCGREHRGWRGAGSVTRALRTFCFTTARGQACSEAAGFSDR